MANCNPSEITSGENQLNRFDDVPSSSHSSSNKVLSCQICNIVTTVRLNCGAYTCEACKRFYFRNRTNPSALICISGRNNCSLNATEEINASSTSSSAAADFGSKKATRTKAGLLWRFMCPSCRFAKCMSIGMGSKNANAIAKPPSRLKTCSQKEDTALILNPTRNECVRSEETLTTVVIAICDLTENFKHLTLLGAKGDFTDENSAWQSSMTQLEAFAQHLSVFVRKLPGYKDIPVKDRCVLFGNSFSKLIVADSYRQDEPFFGMGNENLSKMIKFYPEYTFIPNEASELQTCFREWQPTPAEIGFLFAFLFFEKKTGSGQLSDLVVIDRSLAVLQSSYEATLAQLCGHSADLSSRKRSQLLHVAALLEESSLRRAEARQSVVQRKPSLILGAKSLFVELLSSNQ